jgi:small redox-active disulfide protein 2
MIIKILGTGCANCKRVKELAKQVVAELALEAQVEEVTDMTTIMSYGVMVTPGIVIDGKVVSYGRVPSHDQMVDLIQQAQTSATVQAGG